MHVIHFPIFLVSFLLHCYLSKFADLFLFDYPPRCAIVVWIYVAADELGMSW